MSTINTFAGLGAKNKGREIGPFDYRMNTLGVMFTAPCAKTLILAHYLSHSSVWW